MTLSRRTILKNLGAASALFGSKSTLSAAAAPPAKAKASTAPPFLRILFEGPWLFCPGGKNMLRAIAPLADGMHQCMCGKWSASGGAIQPISPAPAQAQSWTAPFISGAPLNAFDDKIIAGFSAMGAAYVTGTGLKSKPQANDLTFVLPVPDEVHVGGHLYDGTLTGSTGRMNNMPFTTTVLRYNHLPASTPALVVTDGTQQIALSAGDDLIVRLYTKQCFVAPADAQHVVATFNALLTRVSPAPTLTLALNSTNVILNAMPDKITDPELGVAAPVTVCPRSSTLANCAGGGLGFGGCGDDC
jgi:hypothetical protein